MERVFEASWDAKARTGTAIVLVILTGAAAFLASAAQRLPEQARPAALIVALAPILLTGFGSWAWAPRAFAVTRDAVRVERRLARPLVLPLAAVRSARRLEPGALRGSIRLFGVGGFFGYYGTFRNRALGNYRLYATRTDGQVLLATERGPVVLTPERPDAFVQAVEEARAARG